MDVRPSVARHLRAGVPVVRQLPLWLRRRPEAQRRDVGTVEPARRAPVHVRARASAARRASTRRHVVQARRTGRAGAAADPVAAPAARVGPCRRGDAAHAGVDAAWLPLQRQAQARAARGRAADRRPDADAPTPFAPPRAPGGDPGPDGVALHGARTAYGDARLAGLKPKG